MEDKEIEMVASLVSLSKEVATMIINGIPAQTQTVTNCAVVCPVCNKTIYEFPQGVDRLEAIKILTREDAQTALNMIARYCPGCGQKLTYRREIIDLTY